MAYVTPNFKSAAALKRALEAGEYIRVWQPGGIGKVPRNGTVYLEGPHYPAAHTWYAQATMKDGVLIKVK